MKEGWKYVKIKELGKTQTGTTPSKSISSNYGNYIPFIRPAELDINGSGEIQYESEIWLSKTGLDKGRLFKAPSILMCCIGSVGKTGFSTKDVSCNQQINVLTPNSENNAKYLYYALISPMFQTEIQTIARGAQATLPIINKSKWENISIPVPPLSEQQQIVDFLDAEFAKIDELKNQAEQSLQNAKDLFQAALKEMLTPREGWKTFRMDELCSIDSKLVDPRLDQYNKLLHVGGANIVSYTGELIELKTAKEEGLESGKFYFENNVVLYNKIRPYLVKVSRPDFSGLCSADMYPLTPTDIVSKDYLYYILISKDFTDYAILGSGRAGMPKVNRACLFAYETRIPSKEEQNIISYKLDFLAKKQKQLQSNYTRTIQLCADLKQALLRQVFE